MKAKRQQQQGFICAKAKRQQQQQHVKSLSQDVPKLIAPGSQVVKK
ncbi:hypothetical protein [Lysinibacillus sp. CTST325]